MKRLSAYITVVLLLLMPITKAICEVVFVINSNETQEVQELTSESAIRIKGNYIIDSPGAKWYSDEKIAQGQFWGYLDSKENNAPILTWFYPIGTHTPLYIEFAFTNMSTEKVHLLKRVSCSVVYADKYEFEAMPMQENPNQTNEKGETGYCSTDAVPLEPLIGTVVGFFVNVPLITRDSDDSLIAYVTIDDQVTYSINLRDIVSII